MSFLAAPWVQYVPVETALRAMRILQPATKLYDERLGAFLGAHEEAVRFAQQWAELARREWELATTYHVVHVVKRAGSFDPVRNVKTSPVTTETGYPRWGPQIRYEEVRFTVDLEYHEVPQNGRWVRSTGNPVVWVVGPAGEVKELLKYANRYEGRGS